jgi:hypothetical protein
MREREGVQWNDEESSAKFVLATGMLRSSLLTPTGVVFLWEGERHVRCAQDFDLARCHLGFFSPNVNPSFHISLTLVFPPPSLPPAYKKKSDLRVRHREETRVVSRLTMENMNLASRCREAIAQVAALRKELLVHQKRQGEYSNLVKEVERLRRQVGIDTGGVPRGGDFSNSGGTHNIAINAGRDPTSTLPSNVVNDDQQEQTRSPMLSSSTKVSPDGKISHATNNSSNRSDSPATDLDRIMSRQFRKTDRRPLQSNGPAPASSSSASTAKPVATTTTKGGALMNSSSSSSAAPSALKQTRSIAKGNNLMLASSNEKIPISVNATKKMTTPPTSSASSANAPAAVGPSSSEQQQKDDQFDADIDMVDFFAKSQSLLLNDNFGNSVGAHPSSDRSSSHPLPSGVRNHYVRRPRSGSTDDRMPDDVITIASPSLGGSVGAAAGGTVKNPKKASSTSVGLAGGDNNLLSSIDAFEASFAFASAFPETSFSITCDIAPLSSASLAFDVPDFDAFDVPDFDPFFKSLANTTTTTTNSNNNSNNNSLGNRQEAPSLGAEAGARGGTSRSGGAWDGDHGMGKNDNSGAATIKSQMIQDLFPESAMNFKSIPKLESLAFDSNPMMGFEPMERTRVSMTPTTTQHHHHLTATTLVAPERLDDLSKPRINARDGGNASPVAVIPSDPSRDDIRAKILHLEAEKHRLSQIASSQAKLRIGGGAIGNNGPLPHIHRSRLASPISPQSMSAEIEQLDAIADLASRTMRGSGVDVGSATSAASAVVANTNPHIHQTTVRSSVRKMKQPVSYAEPSTKSKLRRGDVLFPKVDSSEKIGGKAGEGAGRITPSTELELVMAQIAAASSQLSADVQD